MADEELAELLKTQKSLTEWLEDINHKDVETLRKEDNEKRERLRVLNDVINLPFDKPTQFEATDLAKKTKKFETFLSKHGNELCALRLIPKTEGLPKLRMRGKSIQNAYVWFLEQKIEPRHYRADFMPHPPDYSWATIFIVNKNGIQGEIIFGGHHLLTQGFHENNKTPLVFRYDFKTWSINPTDNNALKHLQKLASFILVEDNTKQSKLKNLLGSTFVNNYLEGYFETTDSSMGIWYIDYSPVLGKMYSDLLINTSSDIKSKLSGQIGSQGITTGKVVIVPPSRLNTPFNSGSILVCKVTTPDYVPLMRKASAIITDQGGILSHAAIVARELKIPCIVGTVDATKKLKNGQIVTVDANKGVVFCQKT